MIHSQVHLQESQAKTSDTADNTVRFIRESKGRPFFVNVWIHESHTPHRPTKESMEKWKHLDEQKQVYSAVITDGDNDVGKGPLHHETQTPHRPAARAAGRAERRRRRRAGETVGALAEERVQRAD